MKRRDFLKVVGGVAAVTAVGAVATNPRAAQARVCERNVGTLRAIYPVGAIYISTTNTNPADLFGFGTWQAFGAGRTLVGVQTGDAEFGTVQATGGAKTHELTQSEMPRHAHSGARRPLYQRGANGNSASTVADFNPSIVNTGFTGGSGTAQSASDGVPHNNLQPYITVFMWRRSA